MSALYKYRGKFLLVLFASAAVILLNTYLTFRAGQERAPLLWTEEHGNTVRLLEKAKTFPSLKHPEITTPTTTIAPRVDEVHQPAAHQSPSDFIHQQRIDHLRQACATLKNTEGNHSVMLDPSRALENTMANDFFVARVHKLVYCAVQKVGSSFWKRAFRVLNDLAPPGSLFKQSGLASHANNVEITFENRSVLWQHDMLNGSMKFLFVRDPFARTFSAYMDKIFVPFSRSNVRIYNNTEYGSHSFPSVPVRQASANQTRCRLRVPTFSGFIRQIVNIDSTVQSLDGHFSPIHAHCNPCATAFDVVGKMETFRQDTEHILSKVGLKLSDVADNPITFDARSDLNIMSDIAQRVLLSPAWTKLQDRSCWAVRDELFRRMWTMFKVRGLISAAVAYPLTQEQSANATVPDLLLAIKQGFDASSDRQQRMQQRDAALKEAFSAVSMTDLTKLQAFHRFDCMLFDYNCSLSWFVNNQTAHHSNYSYFNIWQ